MLNIEKNQPYLVLGMILSVLLLIPSYSIFYLDNYNKCLVLSILLFLFGVIQIKKNVNLFITVTDWCWWGLIFFTGCSAYGAVNQVYAITGVFTTLLLYLCYKAFEATDWEGKTKWYLLGIIGLCYFTAISMQLSVVTAKKISYFFSDSRLISNKDLPKLLRINLHYIGSLCVILLPFILFQGIKILKILGPLLLLITLAAVHAAGSALVTISCVILTAFYCCYKANLSLKWLAIFLLGLLSLLVITFGITYLDIANLRGYSVIIDEFYSTHDRLWMWQQSWVLFLEAPMLGWGRNNWSIIVGKLGIDDCKQCGGVLLFRHPHNSFFQILSEQGLIGLFFYLGIGGLPCIRLLKKYRTRTLSSLELAAICSLLLFLLMSQVYGVIYNFFNHFKGIPVFVVLCLAILNKGAKLDKIQINKTNNLFEKLFVLITIICILFFYNLSDGYSNYFKGLKSLGKVEKANQYLQAAEPYWDKAIINERLGDLSSRSKRKKQSTNYYKVALQSDPYNVKLNYKYGQSLYEQQNYVKALDYAIKGQQITSNHDYNQLLLAKCYHQLGKDAQALTIAKKLQKKNTRFTNLKVKQFKGSPRISQKIRQKKRLSLQVNQFIDAIELTEKQ